MAAVRRMRGPRLPIGAIIVLVHGLVLGLPIGGIWALRLYESELVRQTEAELTAQAAFVAAVYRDALHRSSPGGRIAADYGRPIRVNDPVRTAARREAARRRTSPTTAAALGAPIWLARPPGLDLNRDRPLPPAPDTAPTPEPAEPAAGRAGRAITPILREAQRTTLAGIRVTDPVGVVVATTRTQLGHALSGWPEVARALDGEYVALLRVREPEGVTRPPLESISRAAQLRVFVAHPILDRDRVVGAVVLSRTPTDLLGALYPQQDLLVMFGLGLMAIMLGVALVTSLAITLPLRAVARQARRAALGERSAIRSLRWPMTREVGDVSDSVETLTRSLWSRERVVRDFARRISHELKTPIANVKGAAELLTDHGTTMPLGERDRFVGHIAHNAEKMERLVHRLLALARAEADAPALGAGVVLGPAVRAAVESAVARGEGPITLTIAPAAETARAAVRPDAFETILTGLVENVRQHGGTRVSIAVSICARRAPAAATVTIDDDGPGIAPAEVERVFDPFFTTAADRGATGLGLTIVKALVDAAGGTITLAPLLPRGTRAEIRLPRLDKP